jgi:hypothetical protein
MFAKEAEYSSDSDFDSQRSSQKDSKKDENSRATTPGNKNAAKKAEEEDEVDALRKLMLDDVQDEIIDLTDPQNHVVLESERYKMLPIID